jgi:hypothetical protein
MPLCPQITNTPITVTQTVDFDVTSVVPAVADTIDGLADEFSSIETMVNGKNKIYRQTTAPTGALTIGDIWFDTDDGNKLYYWTGTAWVSVQDNAIATAQATADSKVKTFYQASPPIASEIGDIWFDTDDGFKQYFWNGTAWTSVQDTAIAAATSAAAAATAAATAAQTSADGKNKIYRQGTNPGIATITGATGNGSTITYTATNAFSTGQTVTVSGINPTRWNASGTITAANSSTFSIAGTTTGTPVYISGGTATLSNSSFSIGDIWFDTANDNAISRWNGSSWVATSLGTNALANFSANKITSGTIDASVITVSNINAGNISTGTLAADRIAAASITGAKIAAGTIQASNIETGTITASQIAASTITGAKIAAATITASNVAANTITASQIAAGTITATQIAAGTITATQIAAGTITTTQLATGTLSANNISTGTLSASVAITAQSGTIGGWNISTSSIYTGTIASPNQFLSSSGGALFTGTVSTENLGVAGTATIGTFNAAGAMFAPNLTTSTSATNLRVATGSIGEIQETSASSIRFKENVVPLSSVEEINHNKLLDLPVRAFTYKEGYLSENDDRIDVMLPGFIAEEVDAIYPVAADYGQDGPHSWNDRFIIPGMLALIQDLYKEVQLLKGE